MAARWRFLRKLDGSVEDDVEVDVGGGVLRRSMASSVTGMVAVGIVFDELGRVVMLIVRPGCSLGTEKCFNSES